jgi:hypothetical protein
MIATPRSPAGAFRAEAWGGVLFQQAWVTNDMEQALLLLGGLLGASDFARVDDRVLRVQTPSGEWVLHQRLAFADAGGMMIEIVEPLGDDHGFWSENLPVDRFAVRLHHLSVRIEGERPDWLAYRDNISARVPISAEGAVGHHHFLFADLRDLLGCYLEAVWKDAARKM